MVASAPRRAGQRRFYAQSLTEAERSDLSAALEVDGFEEEIATLRLRLRSAIEEHPEDLPLMFRGMDVLRRMVATKYGLSRGERRELAGFAAETLRRMR